MQSQTDQDDINSKQGDNTERSTNVFNNIVINQINSNAHEKYSRKGSLNSEIKRKSESHSPRSTTSHKDLVELKDQFDQKPTLTNNKSFRFGNDTTPKKLNLVTELVDEEVESPDNKRARRTIQYSKQSNNEKV